MFLDLKKLKDERSQTLKRYALETLENRHLLLAGTGDYFYIYILVYKVVGIFFDRSLRFR